MDTTGLAKNYYLDDENSDDEDNNNMYDAQLGTKQEIDKFNYSMDQKTKYRSSKISIMQFAELEYKPKLLNILLF